MNKVAKQQIQGQLRQYLKDYRNINELSAEQAAEKIGVEIATYRTLEGLKPANRVLSVLEYLETIAALNKMSLSSFMAFLERNQRTESGSNDVKRKLYDWERDLLNKFDKIGIPLRNRFMKGFLSRSDEQVREILTCLVQIVSLPDSKRNALFHLVREMQSDA